MILIASGKSQSARGASHQPAFMSSCLTIIHATRVCLLYLVEERCYFGVIYLLGGWCAGKGRRVVTWEGRKGA